MKLLFLFSIFICLQTDAFKILIYNSNFGFSHMRFMGKIADILQEAGHSVTVLQPLIRTDSPETGSHLARVVKVPINMTGITTMTQAPKSFWEEMWMADTQSPFNVLKPTGFMKKYAGRTVRCLMNNTEMLDNLKNEKFDLGIAELFDFSPFAIFHHINLTNIVGAHSSQLGEGTAWAIGAPVLPSYVPASHGISGDSGSLFERLENTIFTLLSYEFQRRQVEITQSYMDTHMPDAPKIWDTISNMPLILTNSEPLLDFPRPTLEKIIDLGGIGLKKSKPLDEKWNSVLKLRPKTVLVSFGSVAHSKNMPNTMKNSIINVMNRFPNVTFIWKYENPDDLTLKDVKNVILTKWQPQTDLLADPRLSLFVTHGGAGSIMESAHFGVPLIVVPLFGDQMRNAQMVKRLGFGIPFRNSDLCDANKLGEVLLKALQSKELKEKAELLKRMLEKKPFSPQEKLVRSINMAGEFGSMTNLSPKGRSFTVVQYFNIDVLALVVLVLIVCLAALIYTVSVVASFLCNLRSLHLKKIE